MTQHVVKNAHRTEKRKFNKVLNNDLLKYIAELVTNSDDSYSRLEKAGKIESDQISPIYIHIINTRSKRELIVVDNAEGMSDIDLHDKFKLYGEDTSGGNVRGLFGQGASDVLFNASLHGKPAEIISFKENDLYMCKFKWNKGRDKIISPQRSQRSKSDQRNIRSTFNIKRNGTIVKLGLPDQVAITRNLSTAIKNFYMLRFILNKPNREVALIYKTGNKNDKEILSYKFPAIDESNLLYEEELDLTTEGFEMSGHIKLVRKASEQEDLKILCFDDKRSVYDNSLFEYENYPGSSQIHGTLELRGASEYIRHKMNQERPEEVVTESRDGFNKHHRFYKEVLNKRVDPIIQGVLNQISKETPDKSVELNKQKEWSDALKEINKYIEEEIEEEIGAVNKGTSPPSDGLRFITTNVNITGGKKYSTKLLINLEMLPPDTKIKLKSQSKNVEFTPSKIVVSKDDKVNGDLAVKAVSILGLTVDSDDVIEATSDNGYTAKLFIKVINKEIYYPNYGFEFKPKSLTVKPHTEHTAKLFINTEKLTIGSSIQFTAIGQNVQLYGNEFTIRAENIIGSNIARINIKFLARDSEDEEKIVATSGSTKAELGINITSKEENDGGGGLISGVRIKSDDSFWQTFYNRKTGEIFINSDNVTNKLHLGEIKTENYKPSKDARKYLAELCSNEAAKQLIRLKVEGNSSKLRDNDYEALLDEIQREKNNLINIFIKFLRSYII